MRNTISHITVISTLNFLVLNSFPVQAQNPQAQLGPQCQEAITMAKNTLGEGRDVTTDILNIIDMRGDWISGFPSDRPYSVLLLLNGRNANDVMSSPQLLTTTSAAFMEQCPSASVVRYVLDGTDYALEFGLVNGRVIQFECASPDAEMLEWGQYYCI